MCVLSLLSKTYQYVYAIETHEVFDRYIVKIANSRELIAQLPEPQNVQRNLDLIPDVPVRLLLSTCAALPLCIEKKIDESENRGYFTSKSLLGLCLSGRGVPLEIFLHDHVIMSSDPKGEVFQEVLWHELVHGLEGVFIDHNGLVMRHSPWSYELQQSMLSLDKKYGHVPKLSDDLKARSKSHYLRVGTSLQDNVSEIFARIAVIFMFEIQDSGKALTCGEEFLFLTARFKDEGGKLSRKDANISDFFDAFSSYSEAAQELFISELDTVFQSILALYGCEINVEL